MIFMKNILFAILLVVTVTFSNAQLEQAFQLPPQEILELVDIKATPVVRLDSKSEIMVFLERSTFKSLDELAEEEVRLGGIRINPVINGPSRSTVFTSLSIKNSRTGKDIQVSGLPSGLKMMNFSFSPDDSKFAFTNTTETGMELWCIDLTNGVAKKLRQADLNATLGFPYSWGDNSNYILCRSLPSGRKKMTPQKVMPKGPTVQETTGKKAPNRTYQDLLKNKSDEELFDYYTQSEIIKITLDGTGNVILPADNYFSQSISPDGKYLLVQRMQKPYSYIVPANRFPVQYDIYDLNGKKIKAFYSKPLIEELPTGFDACETGKRNIAWREDQGSTLYWVEAQDGGDPNKDFAIRDNLYQLAAPFDDNAVFVASIKNRFNYIEWGNNNYAIIVDEWWKNRNTKTYLINPSKENKNPEIIFDRSSEDAYTEPGNFYSKKNNFNRYTLAFSKDGKKIFLSGEGYSPEGNKPFLKQFDLVTKKITVLWQADGKTTYESIVRILDPEKKIMLTSIESIEKYPNYFLRSGSGNPKQITFFKNPYESFMGVKKEKIYYKRKDGVDLSATLYLPKGYDKAKQGPLPVLMWAYPREFKSKGEAGQVRESPHRFTRLFYGSAVYWAVRGYAVLDNTDFPIVGEGSKEPNDSFIEQLVANAQAAIDKLAELGVGDRNRIAIGGHSYGAFMTANLMAHCDLFAAGIARSGAYNRTLTPFGFQAEERTFWEAKNVYMEMSPFYYAEKINEPLLLIHGDADNNPGTFTLQSERLYGAIKGLGGTSRLVLLPYESHGYASRENILHMLWEMDTWLEKYVKNKK